MEENLLEGTASQQMIMVQLPLVRENLYKLAKIEPREEVTGKTKSATFHRGNKKSTFITIKHVFDPSSWQNCI
jgi:hypothetical protein